MIPRYLLPARRRSESTLALCEQAPSRPDQRPGQAHDRRAPSPPVDARPTFAGVPSHAFARWESNRVDRLDELEEIHARLTGTEPGRRWLTDELNRGYVVILASQFQGYCRDLHSEMAEVIARAANPAVRGLFESSLALRRNLDRGNATPGNIGADFGRFGFEFWDAIYQRHQRNKTRVVRLDQLVTWRNSIAHDSPIPPTKIGLVAGTKPTLTCGRRWRRSLAALVPHFDAVAAERVEDLVANRPW